MNAITAYNLLKDIPEDQFITGYFSDRHSKCCVAGHLVRLTGSNPKDYSITNCYLGSDTGPIADFVRREVRDFTKVYSDLTCINNNPSEEYPEETPKLRVMAVLNDMIKDKPNQLVISYKISLISRIKNFFKRKKS